MDEDRLDAIERRLTRVEDELAIIRLVASYGPLVDAGEADATAALWAEDGGYDVEGWQMRSRADVAAMVRSEGHQHLIENGCTHFLGPAAVHLDGDEAVAVCASVLVRHREDGYSVRRAGANRFRLRRAPGSPHGWEIIDRRTRALDGSAEARAVLAELVEGRQP